MAVVNPKLTLYPVRTSELVCYICGFFRSDLRCNRDVVMWDAGMYNGQNEFTIVVRIFGSLLIFFGEILWWENLYFVYCFCWIILVILGHELDGFYSKSCHDFTSIWHFPQELRFAHEELLHQRTSFQSKLTEKDSDIERIHAQVCNLLSERITVNCVIHYCSVSNTANSV